MPMGVYRRPWWVIRFLSKIELSDGCWNWTAHLLPNGYGQFNLGKGLTTAHRVSFAMSRGRPPKPGMFVCHTCDNRRCVRPDHLWEGAPAENSADMAHKKRADRRDTRYNAKVKTSDIPDIMRMRAQGMTLKEIGTHYGCSLHVIHVVCKAQGKRKGLRNGTRARAHPGP